MPIYEYECRKCKAHTEVLQKISDKPPVKCRACGGRLEKMWSQTGFQFKGAGWYVTDYAGRKSDTKDGDAKEADAKETKNEKTDKDIKAGKDAESAPAETSSNGSGASKKQDKKMPKTASPTKASTGINTPKD